MTVNLNKVNIFVSDTQKELAAFSSNPLTVLFTDVSLIGKKLNFDILEPSGQRTKFGEYTVRDKGIAPQTTTNSKDLKKVNIFVSDATKELAAFSVDELTTLFATPALAGKHVNFDILQFNGQRIKFGEYTVKGQLPHVCADANAHWDETLQRCICNTGYKEVAGICVKDVVPNPTGQLWNSNKDGGWNDGKPRTLTQKQPSTFKNDGSIFVAASGSPVLIIDGDGVAHLKGGTGGVDNLSLKLRSRHQSGGACENRGGGEGFAVDRKAWDSKRETCHNIHDSLGSGSLSQTLKDETWYKIRFTCKDEGTNKIRLIGELDYGSGFKKEMDLVDSRAEAWFFDKALILGESWFWIRINNSDHPRIYVCKPNYDSILELDFKFEPSKSSVGLRDVTLSSV